MKKIMLPSLGFEPRTSQMKGPGFESQLGQPVETKFEP